MKSKSYIFCFVAFVICFIGAYLIGYNLVLNEKSKEKAYNEVDVQVVHDETINNDTLDKKTVNTDTETTISRGVEINGYWIKTQNEYIVIYNNHGELLANTEISIANFSEKDRQILKEGIYVENAEALFRCLESYTS